VVDLGMILVWLGHDLQVDLRVACPFDFLNMDLFIILSSPFKIKLDIHGLYQNLL